MPLGVVASAVAAVDCSIAGAVAVQAEVGQRSQPVVVVDPAVVNVHGKCYMKTSCWLVYSRHND